MKTPHISMMDSISLPWHYHSVSPIAVNHTLHPARSTTKPGRVMAGIAAAIFSSVLPIVPVNMAAQAEMGAYVDAEKSFAERQDILVNLAAVLGALHHLRDICFPNETPQKWRGYMKELITLEHPIEGTQNRMIEAFNNRYQEMKARFSYCDARIEEETNRFAGEGRHFVGVLRSHFPTNQGIGGSYEP